MRPEILFENSSSRPPSLRPRCLIPQRPGREPLAGSRCLSGGLLPISSPSGLGAGALPPLPSHLGSELGGWAEAAARAAHLPAVSWQRLCPRGRRGKGEERRGGITTDVRMGGDSSGSCVLEPPPCRWSGPSCSHPRAPRAGWGLSASPGLRARMSLGVLSNADDLGLLCWGPPRAASWGRWGCGMCRSLLSPPCKSGMVPGAEGMRARPTSPFSHYFSKGK